MNKDDLNKISELFSGNKPDKWNSFLQLIERKDELVKLWYSDLKDKLSEIKLNNGWTFNKDNGNEWYLKKFGPGSLGLWLEQEHFSLKLINCSKVVFDKIDDKLKQDMYTPIFTGIEHKTPHEKDWEVLIRETGRFEFEDVSNNENNHFKWDQLIWYGHWKTDDYVKQVERKLAPFFEIKTTELISDLNIWLETQNSSKV